MLMRLRREERCIETKESVNAHLQQHTSQQHRTSSRSLDVCVRQPCVEREQRNLHRERNEEAEEEKFSSVIESRNGSTLNCALYFDVIKTAGLDVKPDDRRQHEHRRDHRVQEEFHRGIDATLMSVHADH